MVILNKLHAGAVKTQASQHVFCAIATDDKRATQRYTSGANSALSNMKLVRQFNTQMCIYATVLEFLMMFKWRRQFSLSYCERCGFKWMMLTFELKCFFFFLL
jgi:hypothetical protein